MESGNATHTTTRTYQSTFCIGIGTVAATAAGVASALFNEQQGHPCRNFFNEFIFEPSGKSRSVVSYIACEYATVAIPAIFTGVIVGKVADFTIKYFTQEI